MKSARDPRVLIAILLLLVSVAFLGGTIRLIRSARAADQQSDLAKGAFIQSHSISIVAEPAADRGGISLASTLVPAGDKPSFSAQATPTPSEASADTSGIIALAIVIVVTIVLGAAIGVRNSSPPKASPR